MNQISISRYNNYYLCPGHLVMSYFLETIFAKLLLSKNRSLSMSPAHHGFVAVYVSIVLHSCFQEPWIWEVLRGVPRTRVSSMKNTLSHAIKSSPFHNIHYWQLFSKFHLSAPYRPRTIIGILSEIHLGTFLCPPENHCIKRTSLTLFNKLTYMCNKNNFQVEK